MRLKSWGGLDKILFAGESLSGCGGRRIHCRGRGGRRELREMIGVICINNYGGLDQSIDRWIEEVKTQFEDRNN